MKRYASLIVFFISILLAGYGLFTNEANILWQKAITICLSCIGIG